MRRFYEQALEIPDIRIYGDFSQKDRAAIVSLNLGEEDSAQVSDYLSEEYDIATRSGGHCAPLMHEALKTVEQGRYGSVFPILIQKNRSTKPLMP